MKKKKKKALIAVVIIACIVVFGIVFFNIAISGFNNSAGDHQQILKADSQSKTALVVYQPSFSGITNKMAQQIAKGLNDAGYQVVINNPGTFLSADASQYAVLVFGSPVYAGKLSPVLLDYLKTVKIDPAQKVILFDTGSVNSSAELDTMASLITNTTNVTKIKFIVNNNDNDSKAYDLGKGA